MGSGARASPGGAELGGSGEPERLGAQAHCRQELRRGAEEMATFFGEVVVAPSRSGVDDEEEAREETPEDREIRRELEKKR